jgi:hypothetical protein
MAELKTKKTRLNVDTFLKSVKDETKRDDCYKIIDMMQQATKAEPKIWGTAIIGFGDYRYKSERTGREGDWFVVGFSPRKANITLYLVHGLGNSKLLEKLGKFKTTGGCLYLNKLSDVNTKVLAELIKFTVKSCPASKK